ncbi:MAG: copper amine oxidase N-terminal domain-containing protein [Clostridiales bacterium]|jgi:hypothetical protein|nr:copper amine oxidase N-terminal domain-containing protein [Clostridiales bacterium]
MFRNKRFTSFVLSLAILISSVIGFASPKVFAANTAVTTSSSFNTITIYVDGKALVPDEPARIIADRVMVPFRYIGEALGARCDWIQSEKKVTMSLGNRALDFVIGSSTMNLAVTAAGGVVRTSINLEAPAMLVNDRRAFVPIRAVSEGLGAQVAWAADTFTVTVTSLTPLSTPTPIASPTPIINSAFANNDYFEIIDFSRAQAMYDLNNKAVFMYFDSGNPEAINRMPMIISAAQTINQKVYGLDVRTSKYVEKMSWIWSYLDRTVGTPQLVFSYGKTSILKYNSFASQTELNTYFDNWNRGYYSSSIYTPTPTPTSSVSPTPTPYNYDRLNDYFINITKTRAIDYYDEGDTFILVVYNSDNSDYDSTELDIIQSAVLEARERVYYTDTANHSDYYWFPEELFSSDSIPNPVILYISDNRIVTYDDYFRSVTYVADDIKDFLDDYDY